eukprot:9297172-Pyramimonas_sp.AAC.3
MQIGSKPVHTWMRARTERGEVSAPEPPRAAPPSQPSSRPQSAVGTARLGALSATERLARARRNCAPGPNCAPRYLRRVSSTAETFSQKKSPKEPIRAAPASAPTSLCGCALPGR